MYWRRRLSDSNARASGKTFCGKWNNQRAVCKQGRPLKSVWIEEQLIDWFSKRRRRGRRVTPKLFLERARAIRLQYA